MDHVVARNGANCIFLISFYLLDINFNYVILYYVSSLHWPGHAIALH